MKCRVCQTPIPLGHKECPNCGYKIENHSSQHLKTRFSQFDVKKQHRIIKAVCVSIIGIVMMALIFSYAKTRYEHRHFNTSPSTVHHQSFAELIKDNKDQNHTIADTVEYGQKIEQYMKDHDFEKISHRELCHSYGDTLYATYSIKSYLKDICYDIDITYTSQTGLSETRLIVSYRSLISMKSKPLLVQQADVDAIGELLKIDQAYQKFDDVRLRLEKEESEKNKYTYFDSNEQYTLLVYEQYYDTKDPYYVHHCEIRQEFE